MTATHVVSDTGPIHYLVLFATIDILPTIFETVSIPRAVHGELTHAEAPAAVRDWIAAPPPWLSTGPDSVSDDPSLARLHAGERQVILLARAMSAELVLMDDRAGVRTAQAAGFGVAGTLGLLGLGHRRSLLDLGSCVERLRRTSFRCRPALYDRPLTSGREASSR